jgi:hypothetical protein
VSRCPITKWRVDTVVVEIPIEVIDDPALDLGAFVMALIEDIRESRRNVEPQLP